MTSVDNLLTKSGANDFWSSCLSRIESEVTSQQFHTWFDSLKYNKIENNTLYLTAEGSFIAEWIQKNYHNLVLNAVQHFDSSVLYLDFAFSDVVEINAFPAAKACPRPKVEVPVLTDILKTPSEMGFGVKQHRSNGVLKQYMFDNFIKAENNELVYVAAKNVAQAPGRNSVNPLIIYGGTGMGKTHLLHAIGNHALRHQTASRVLYRTSDRFISDFMKSLSHKDSKESFWNTYKDIDILLIDDIQFLANKASTQEEFFKIFETLRSMNKQVVMTCDKDPNDVKGLNERLLNRFESGLAAPVYPASYETRLEILKQKIERDNTMRHYSIDILKFIAERCVSNIRELEGALTRLFAYSSLMGRDLTLEAAKSVLMGVVAAPKGAVSIQKIIETVGAEFDVESDSICSSSRLKKVAQPRKMAMYLARNLTGSTLHTIAAHFNRDYSTVIHAIKSFEQELSKDLLLNNKMHKLKSYLTGK